MDGWNDSEDEVMKEETSDSFFDDSYEYARDGPVKKRSRKKGRTRDPESNFDGELKRKNFIEDDKKDFMPDEVEQLVSDDPEADVPQRTKRRNRKKTYHGKSPEEKKALYRKRLKAKAKENRLKQRETLISDTSVVETPVKEITNNLIISETPDTVFVSESENNPDIHTASNNIFKSKKSLTRDVATGYEGNSLFYSDLSVSDGGVNPAIHNNDLRHKESSSEYQCSATPRKAGVSEHGILPESGKNEIPVIPSKQVKKTSFALFGSDDTDLDTIRRARISNAGDNASDISLADSGLKATELTIRKAGEVISKSTGDKDDSAASDTLKLGEDAGISVSKYGFYVAEDTAGDIFKTTSKPKKKVSDYTSDSVFEVTKKELTKEEEKKIAYRRRLRKRRMKEYRKAKKAAVETGKKTAEESRKLISMVKSAIQTFIAAIPKTLLIILLLILILILFGGEMAGSVVSLTTETASILSSASYHSDPYMIDQADLTMSYKELMLRDRIDEIEDEYPDYEEYSYTIGNIGHDPFTLINYLSAEYGEITPDVMDSIDGLFNSMYYLKILAIDDVRYRWVLKPPEEDEEDDLEENEEDEDDEESEDDGEEDEDDEEPEYILEEYIVKVLKVELQSKSLESIVETRLADNSFKKTVYQILNITHGLTQYIGTPVWNTWSVRSYYGYRRNPGGDYDELHRGLDIELPYGSNVQSAISGEVMEVSSDPMYGEYIVIEDIGTRYKVKYANLGRVSVIEGERVFMGQTIGHTGGGNEGSCLHMEFLINNNYMNPLFYTKNPIPDG